MECPDQIVLKQNSRILLPDKGIEKEATVADDNVGSDSLTITIDPLTHEVRFIPALNFWRFKIPVVFTVTDSGGLSCSDTVMVSVIPRNDPPRLSALPSITMLEDDSSFIPFTLWFGSLSDPDDQASSHRWYVSNGNHVRCIPKEGGIILIPGADWFGKEPLIVTVQDPMGLSDTAELLVRVLPVNDSPRIVSAPDTTASVEMPYVYQVIALDVDTVDTFFSYEVRGPEWLSFSPDGKLSGVPAGIGSYPITVLVYDNHMAVDSQTFVLHVSSRVGHVRENQHIPTEFSLYQNFPNPFNSSTTITFDLPEESLVSLSIYDMAGREVLKTPEENMQAGVHQKRFTGTRLATGMYIYRLYARPLAGNSHRDFVAIKRMMLIK
jgi:hypothetical protein